MEDKLKKFTMMIIHSVPMFCLIIDDLFLNSLGLLMRHYTAVLFVTVCYLIVNMSVALAIQPVYPGMTWNSLAGVALPLGLVIVSFLIYLAACQITILKMKFLG